MTLPGTGTIHPPSFSSISMGNRRSFCCQSRPGRFALRLQGNEQVRSAPTDFDAGQEEPPSTDSGVHEFPSGRCVGAPERCNACQHPGKPWRSPPALENGMLASSTLRKLDCPFLLQNCIDEFGAINGGCERLLSTPLPLSYTRHCSRTLFMWLLSLPVVLWSSMGPAMIPAVFFVSYVLLGKLACLEMMCSWGFRCLMKPHGPGIDELASEIEEPFSILPLTPLTNIIVQETQELFQMG